MKVIMIPIINGVLSKITKGLVDGLEDLEIGVPSKLQQF